MENKFLIRNNEGSICDNCRGYHSFITKNCVPIICVCGDWIWEASNVVYVSQDDAAQPRYGVRARLDLWSEGDLPVYIYYEPPSAAALGSTLEIYPIDE